ncbi:uncharacterized protein METZ01_LOCUS308872, partial [marine metagenome]
VTWEFFNQNFNGIQMPPLFPAKMGRDLIFSEKKLSIVMRTSLSFVGLPLITNTQNLFQK